MIHWPCESTYEKRLPALVLDTVRNGVFSIMTYKTKFRTTTTIIGTWTKISWKIGQGFMWVQKRTIIAKTLQDTAYLAVETSSMLEQHATAWSTASQQTTAFSRHTAFSTRNSRSSKRFYNQPLYNRVPEIFQGQLTLSRKWRSQYLKTMHLVYYGKICHILP